MKSHAAFAASILLLAFGQTALAQPTCLMCRAQYQYGKCPAAGINKPPPDGISFTGTVTAAKPIDCGVQITVVVTRASSRSLPKTIVIDVAHCTYWIGAVGDPITAVVSAERQETGAYAASVNCGGTR